MQQHQLVVPSTNLHVPCSVLAFKPNNNNSQQKSTGILIEVRRYISDYHEMIPLTNNNNTPFLQFHYNNNNSSNEEDDANAIMMMQQQSNNSNTSTNRNPRNNNNIESLLLEEDPSSVHYVGFIRWSSGQDDRRISTWLPVSQIFFPDGTSLGTLMLRRVLSSSSSNSNSNSSSQQQQQLHDLQQLISTCLTNRKVRAPIPFDVRHRLITQTPTRHELEFLEERLRKDGEVPTVHYRMKYLDFSMQPWYYAPYDVVFPQFTTQSQRKFGGSSGGQNNNQNQNQNSATFVNGGFLFDCHICPFTLQPFRFASELKRSLVRRLEDQQQRLKLSITSSS